MRLRRGLEEERGGPEANGPGGRLEEPGARGRASRAHPRRVPRWAKAVIAAVVCILLLWAMRAPLLTGVAQLLVARDEPSPADLIYQFGGDWIARSRVSADLYHRDFAPRVALMEVERSPEEIGLLPGETEATVRLLERHGVPRAAIVVYRSGDGVGSTTEEAEALAGVLRRAGTRRIITVTSWYHTRRARWALRRALDGAPIQVMMVGASTPEFSASNWWRGEKGLLSVFEEYLKFAHNWAYR